MTHHRTRIYKIVPSLLYSFAMSRKHINKYAVFAVAQQQFDIRDTVFELNRLFADANIGSIEPNRQLNAARVQKFCRCATVWRPTRSTA